MMEAPRSEQETKYIQQHLANERTFLAWVRTAITIVGIGFLVINLHVTGSTGGFADMLVLLIGAAAVITGILTILAALWSYFDKTSRINQQTFRSAKATILLLGIMMVLIITIFGVYFFSLQIG
ncbi:YidH family protein [Peribacillus sp. SCS-155]|uniref:YidH family protein n=1 Tax=Peribacillus sedimenti TaxID=3115297 RepID=UPI003906CBC5